MNITYARAGGPPSDWASLEVVDLETGERLKQHVLEVNAREGWAVVYTGRPDPETERIEGRFEIRKREAS